MLVDSHCHLDFPQLAGDLEGVLARARDAGVGLFQTIGTRLSTFPNVCAIAEAHAPVYCSVGVHPHNVADEPVTPETLVERAGHAKVIGLGETGLDYYYDHAPRATQRAAFAAHIQAARATGLPLIVHSRDADDDTVDTLAAVGQGEARGVIHCFSSDRVMARRCLNLGFVISFSGIVTFRNAEEMRAVARMVPLDRMLVETDAPYLAPVPMRGRSNEPAFVAHTARVVAEQKGVGPDALAEATTATFLNLFTKARAPSCA
ncbi:MAG: TatD family deoxyribonuclease [Alphaproteobacteria bacterium]|nr:TatD family deoxyribonuclease [Alphaproteobacteria bacterium]